MHVPVGYAEYPAPARMADVVACLWSRSPSAAQVLVLPDACVDLIWSGAGEVFAAGPDTRAMLMAGLDDRPLIGIRFHPGAGGAALGLPLIDIQNQRVPWRQLWEGRLRRSRRPDVLSALLACEDARDPDSAIHALIRFAGLVCADVHERTLALETARRMRSPGQQVRSLADDLGVSQRHLHRTLVQDIGYGAKTLQRVYRFQRFLAARSDGASLAQRAASSGYADQAHLTRDCVDLSGMTPRALLATR